jgi:restriction endonuclease Mrr
VPQADRLPNIRRLAAAAREGIYPSATLRELLGVNARHFGYYRQAAEILGIVACSRDGGLALTSRGRDLLSTREGSPDERRAFADAISSARALKPLTSFFAGDEVSIDEIATRLEVMTGLSRATAERRARTLGQWRKYIREAERTPADSPELSPIAPAIENVVANHNALAKQRHLESLLKMDPGDFERLIGRLAVAMGHSDVKVVGGAGDGGVDVEALAVGSWGASRLVLIQAKRYTKPLGRRFVDELAGVVARRRGAEAILVTTSEFTQDAEQAARDAAERVTLVNGPQLVDLLAKHAIGLRFGKYGEIEVAR